MVTLYSMRGLEARWRVMMAFTALCVCFHVDPAAAKAKAPKDPWEGDMDTVLLDNSNFTSFVQSQKLVMVEFYQSHCGHCRQFAPHYAKAASILKEDGIPIAKVSLDNPANHPFAQQFQIQGFPTIRIFKDTYDSDKNNPLHTMDKYDTEDRTTDAVVSHMRTLGLPPKLITSEAELESVVAASVKYTADEIKVLVLGVFADENSENFKAFKEAKFGRLAPTYVWVKDAALANKYLPEGHSGDAVLVITDFKDDASGPIYRLPSESLSNVDAIFRFVEINSGPLVWKYADALSSQITQGKVQRFCWAFVDRNSAFWEQYEKALMEVSAEERGKMKFVMVPAEAEGLFQFFRIDKAALPQLLIIDLHPEVGQRQFKYGIQDPKTKEWNTEKAKLATPQLLREFVSDYNAGKLQRYLRSEPQPAAQDGPVIKVVGSMFEDLIREGKDVLINFYGDFSWCKHCEVFAPEWEKVGAFFKEVPRFVVGKMDFQANDIEDAKKRGIAPTGFPDVYLFRADKPDAPVRFDSSKYNDERGLGAVSKFVKDHASVPLVKGAPKSGEAAKEEPKKEKKEKKEKKKKGGKGAEQEL